MDVLILTHRIYPCKLLTFVDRISDGQVQVWCEIVKEENCKEHINRLEEDLNLKKIRNAVSSEIFIKEQQRVRVDVSGTSRLEKFAPKTSLLMTFIPVAECNHLFPTLSKNVHIGGDPNTILSYWTDSESKTHLYTVSFDPWVLKICKPLRNGNTGTEERREIRVLEREAIEERETRIREEAIRRIEEQIQRERRRQTEAHQTGNTPPQTKDHRAQFAISDTKRRLINDFEEFLEKFEILHLREPLFANGIINTKTFLLLKDENLKNDLGFNLGHSLQCKEAQRSFIDLD